MFKNPNKHLPREWGRPGKTPLIPTIAVTFCVAAALIALLVLPPGGEIAVAIFGFGLCALLYRMSK